MSKIPLHYTSIFDLHSMIRSKKISPKELTKIFLNRIEIFNEKYKAFCEILYDKAIHQADACEKQIYKGDDLGILHGIPFAVKDLYDVEGLPTTAGTHLLKNCIAKKDATIINRLKRSGMILLGKTNTVQFAYGGVGINHDQGTPLNPWGNGNYVPGGSSSGSGVAVSLGLAPMALGTDTGGSVRVPASLCGISGLKPTVGRVSRFGIYPLSSSMDSFGPLASSIEDLALVFSTIYGEDEKDPTTIDLPKINVIENLKKGINRFRLAIPNSIFWDDIHKDVEKAVLSSKKVFEELGAEVEEIDFPVAKRANALNSKSLLTAAEAYSVNKSFIDEHFHDLDPIVSRRMINGKFITAADYLNFSKAWIKLQKEAIEELDHIDALIVPTTCIPALPTEEIDKDLETYFKYNTLYLRNTSIGNTLNLCAVSIPCGFTKNKLPIGLTVYAKPFREDLALRIGYAFQRITDWHLKKPKID